MAGEIAIAIIVAAPLALKLRRRAARFVVSRVKTEDVTIARRKRGARDVPPKRIRKDAGEANGELL
jgi:hypothetical protein